MGGLRVGAKEQFAVCRCRTALFTPWHSPPSLAIRTIAFSKKRPEIDVFCVILRHFATRFSRTLVDSKDLMARTAHLGGGWGCRCTADSQLPVTSSRVLSISEERSWDHGAQAGHNDRQTLKMNFVVFSEGCGEIGGRGHCQGTRISGSGCSR